MRNIRRAQHRVLVFAGDHASQQCDDPFVFGKENLLGQVFDIRLHPRAVLLGKAYCRSYPGEHVLLACLYEGDLPAAVFGLFGSIGVGVELSRTSPSSIPG